MESYELKGNLFSAELLENIASQKGQTASDFNLDPNKRLVDEIGRIFATTLDLWSIFQRKKAHLLETESGVKITRENWMKPFFDELGYKLEYRLFQQVDEQSYPLSHRDEQQGGFPIHIEGFRQPLDKNPHRAKKMRKSPHTSLQEYLNSTDHVFGIVTNGLRIRLLRTQNRLSNMQYMEWDLERIMEAADFPAFVLIYRMLHVSKIQHPRENCWLEHFHQDAIEASHRVRNKLKGSVMKCLEKLGNGFLEHPENQHLQDALKSGQLSPAEYGKYLRTLVYRLLFLMVAEEKNLLVAKDLPETQATIYQDYYGLDRLRNLAEKHLGLRARHSDLWEQLKATFLLFEQPDLGKPIGISPLGGTLFHPEALGPLTSARMSNNYLLQAIDRISRFEHRLTQHIRINYKHINVEEFGAVYENLLDLNPEIDQEGSPMLFSFYNGTNRKTTGSYYTHDDLVQQLIKTTLKPVIQKRLQAVKQNSRNPNEIQHRQEQALLHIKVVDPACGSGHFLLGAARELAFELAQARAGLDSTNHTQEEAMRDVIEHCIYGVDINPDAVELCRLALWMEAHVPGKSLTYLDHKIRCGNSLVGWDGTQATPKIPDGAFLALDGDQKHVATALKKRNVEEREGQRTLVEDQPTTNLPNTLASGFTSISNMPSDTLEQIWAKQRAFTHWEENSELRKKRLLYDAWTHAFFQSYAEEDASLHITQNLLTLIAEDRIDPNHHILKEIRKKARSSGYFHWPIEFPDVFGRIGEHRGFDVLLGNPPWERIKIQEKEFFAGRTEKIAAKIVSAPNAAQRKACIVALGEDHPLTQQFKQAKRNAEHTGKFIREAARFSLTCGGDINTYSVFSGLPMALIAPIGYAGVIVPSGIATDHTNRHFFAQLIAKNRLLSLFDFENRAKLFPSVSSLLKFSLLTILGERQTEEHVANLGFSFYRTKELLNEQQQFQLSKKDFLLLNPNTLTCPVFRTKIDAEITRKIYEKFPILIHEKKKKNPWRVQFVRMFDMANDSKLFQKYHEAVNGQKASAKNQLENLSRKEVSVPLYEAKMMWLYNHRYSSYSTTEKKNNVTKYLRDEELNSPNRQSIPRYQILQSDVEKRLSKVRNSGSKPFRIQNWYFCFRDITKGTNERTFVCSVMPKAAFNNKVPLLISKEEIIRRVALQAMLSSLVFDFVARQKIGGVSMTYFYVKQLPIIPPEQFATTDLQFIVPRVLELTYSAWDLKGFVDDVWQEADADMRSLLVTRWKANRKASSLPQAHKPGWVEQVPEEFPHPPFCWDKQHRLRLQCELDAYFAWKYQLDESELKYILDPQDKESMGAGFPGETFRVLKEKEEKEYGEFRTRKLVLEAWQRKPWEKPDVLEDRYSPTVLKSRDLHLAKKLPAVMAYVIHRHQEIPRFAQTLGRTKMEKLNHLIECETQLDFGRQPVKNEHGPADIELLDWVDLYASNAGYFDTVIEKLEGNLVRKRYHKLEKFDLLLQEFYNQFKQHQADIDRILNLFLDQSRSMTELCATLYASWNNLLLEGTASPTDEQIIAYAHTWSTAKQENYSPTDFVGPMRWLREKELVPRGDGKLVSEKAA